MGVGASSSSSSSAVSPKKYDVFLSFRGEDTRRTFTSHLHTALCLRGIQTYIDYELPKGDDISQSLIQAIEDSTISVVVFSENYASSKWCLNELAKILHCKRVQAQLVIPVFYKVDPSDVRNQRGTYLDAFAKHERDFKQNPEKANKWKHALFETASLAGWDTRSSRDEAELIQNIVNDIFQKLNRISPTPSALKDIVGINENSDHIEMLLEKVSIVGIWGMCGIGKTTIAKVVFAKFCSQFDSCCFLENLREESEKHGLKFIRDKLLLELLKDDSPKRLNCKKVFIVLDDVSSTNQLDYLEREGNSLGPGSKVIITTRDRHVLNGKVDKIYEVKALSYCNSLKLFNLKAFHKDDYESGYEELSQRAIAYAKGNPLALVVFGSFLYSKSIEEWDSALRKLEKTTHEDMHAALKLSYDGLNFEEKEMFLDIACFLKGENADQVKALFNSYGFHASIGLRTLIDKALISNNGIVWMHDLIQKVGWEIVRQECMKNPGRRSRLWDPNEIYDVLKNNRGTDAVEGLILDLSQIRDINLSADTLNNMTNLRFLKFYSSWDKTSCILNLPLGLESFSNSLRYLQWDNFPSESLPPSFCAEKLVELNMVDSHLKKLWDGVQDLVNLRKINFGGSKQLIELPNFSKAQNLEKVNLWSCESLCHLHPSILSLHKLSSLVLDNCINLKSLQSESHLESLFHLGVDNCCSLKEFSLSSEKMLNLRLDTTHVEILGSSIRHFGSLGVLSLNGSKLKNFPMHELCDLRALWELHLYDYGEIIDTSKLHTLFDALQSLEIITLDGSCRLTELPNNIKHLSRLRFLSLRNCKSLQSLPELPPSIQGLDATNCTSLKTLLLTSPVENGYLRNLENLCLSGCKQLHELPECIGSLSSLSSLSLEGSNVESLPASIRHLWKLKHIVLRNCRRIHSLPELPPFIELVTAPDCMSLETVLPSLTSTSSNLSLILRNCLRLEKYSLSYIMPFAYFSLKRGVHTNRSLAFCYPGREVSELFEFNQARKASNFVTIELSSTMNNLRGFIFYSILSHFNPVQNRQSCLQCKIYFEDGNLGGWSSFPLGELNSQHVALWCNSNMFTKFQDTNYKPKLSFEFFIVTYDMDGFIVEKIHEGLIEACGVCPIYASEYHKFLQQMESELELSTKRKTCDDVDEHSLLGITEYVNFSLKQAKCGNFGRNFIPEWFPYKSLATKSSISVSVHLAPDFESLLGFIFCFVIPQFSSKERDQSHSRCVYFDEDDFYYKGPRGWHYSMTHINLDNVFLWYDPLFCELILENVRSKAGSSESSKYNLELSFEFEFGAFLIKECGVRPIYNLEYRKFLQQKELMSKSSTGKRMHQNIDDKRQQLPSKKKWNLRRIAFFKNK